MSLLSVDQLTVAFGQSIAVREVTLQAKAGTITGLLGANGAGKTTTLLGIHACVARRAGRITFDGRDVTGFDTNDLVRAGIALCPQNRRLFQGMSIEDNLLLGAYCETRAVRRTRLAEAYERFTWLGERRREPAGRLSGGQQQTVAIARALMSRPKLVLLDEPSSGLSPIAIQDVADLLRQVTEDGTAVLLVEQNVKLVQSLCTDAYVLARGQVKESGPVAELLSGVAVADAYLGGLELTDEAPLPDEEVPQETA
jgi:branched-chain amino acid transport system ATP-binding protein